MTKNSLQDIEDSIRLKNLNKDLTKVLEIKADDLKDYPNFKLNSRVSSKKLLSKYTELVEEAQNCYIESINKAKHLLIENAVSVYTFDEQLKDSDCSENENAWNDTQQSPIQKLNDGTIRKTCPILKCKSYVYKLSRHIADRHPHLTEEQRKHANSIARMTEGATTNIISAADNYSKKSGTQNTKNEPKREYRKCYVCGKLYLNIPDHLRKNHKLLKETSEYKIATMKSEVVPSKYISKTAGRAVVNYNLESNEEDQTENQSKNSAQEEMNKIKSELIACSIEYEQATTKDTEKISEKLTKLKEKYKEIRYGDKRVYSNEAMTWKVQFTKYLEMKR